MTEFNLLIEEDRLLTQRVARLVTGTPWDWYWGDSDAMGIPGAQRSVWQLMPKLGCDEPPFFHWYLVTHPERQWWDDPYVGCAWLIASWYEYLGVGESESPHA